MPFQTDGPSAPGMRSPRPPCAPMPRAFTRSTHMFAYIDPGERWVVVDGATAKKAEELLSALRETLGPQEDPA